MEVRLRCDYRCGEWLHSCIHIYHLIDHFIKAKTLLNSWCSEMGKVALHTLGEILHKTYSDLDDRVAYVAHGLEKKNGYNYVYANPEAQVCHFCV